MEWRIALGDHSRYAVGSMSDCEEEIAKGLDASDEDVQLFAQDLRDYLKELTKPAYELVGQSAQSYNIGYGFTKTSWDCFCAIIAYRGHLNLSFPSGASLSDPEGLLHGNGVGVRHMKIKTLDDLNTPAARELLLKARDQALFSLREKPNYDGVTTVIKKKS